MKRTVFPLVVLLLWSGRLWADEAEDLKEALAALKGSWSVDSFEMDGTQIERPDALPASITFTDEHVTHSGSKTPFTVFAGQTPLLIDFQAATDTDERRTLEGIYKIEDDKLTICIFVGQGRKVRPDTFTTEAGSERVLLRLTRGS